MHTPETTTAIRKDLAREIFVSFVSSPLFATQCNEVQEDTLHDLGEGTARDAFDLADAFLKVALELP